MSETEPKVSVIVPVYNGARSLPRLMASLRGQSYAKERVEIFMVDNNSTDRSLDVLRGFPEVTALRFTEWQSSYASRNEGIKRATGEVCAFIDADCWAHPEWIRNGVRALVEKKLDRAAGSVRFVLSPHPNIYEIFDAARNFRQADFVERGWSGAGNIFVWKRVFDEVGPWNPHLISHGDSEFGLRATAAGKTLGFADDCIIYHKARRSWNSLVKKWIRTEYGAAQVYRLRGWHELHLWYKKANWRPLAGVWKEFPEEYTRSPRVRMEIDGIANILRYSGNLGNFLGWMGFGGRGGPRGT